MTLRDEIAKIISEGQRYDCSSGQLADDVYFLIAPELEKARKWDRTLNAFWEFPEYMMFTFSMTSGVY